MSFELAWRDCISLLNLTPEEKQGGAEKLREFIQNVSYSGEGNPHKIAKAALSLLREYEQIERSRAQLGAVILAHVDES
jgi:hypothetical protein